ncbi:MAG: hypothetical protein ACYTG0_33460 [Planctomycetota bacterium]|jgi:hypothetical protein
MGEATAPPRVLTPEQQQIVNAIMSLMSEGFQTHRMAAIGLANTVQAMAKRCVNCITLESRCDDCSEALIKMSAYATFDLTMQQQMLRLGKKAIALGLEVEGQKKKPDS